MDTMERLHLFSTRRTRERMKRSSVERAKIAAFHAGRLATMRADKEAAAMSPVQKTEAQSRSSAERRKFTPAV
jgi:hypothetical protein